MTLAQQQTDAVADPATVATGQPWWIVIARLAYDDEDGIYIFQADSKDDAVRRAEHERRGDDDDFDDREFYLNYVVRCESKPEMVVYNV